MLACILRPRPPSPFHLRRSKDPVTRPKVGAPWEKAKLTHVALCAPPRQHKRLVVLGGGMSGTRGTRTRPSRFPAYEPWTVSIWRAQGRRLGLCLRPGPASANQRSPHPSPNRGPAEPAQAAARAFRADSHGLFVGRGFRCQPAVQELLRTYSVGTLVFAVPYSVYRVRRLHFAVRLHCWPMASATFFRSWPFVCLTYAKGNTQAKPTTRHE